VTLLTRFVLRSEPMNSAAARRVGPPAAAIAACVTLLSSCGGLPTGRRIDDGRAVQRALSEALDIELILAPTVRMPVDVADQSLSYYGANDRETLLVVVFDSEDSVVRVLGTSPDDVSSHGRIRVVTRRNVVLFYMGPPGREDRLALTLRILREVI
jgi:hypothetical protein